jgi:hypothetical protein
MALDAREARHRGLPIFLSVVYDEYFVLGGFSAKCLSLYVLMKT